jgi:hypothetical protein
MENLIFQYRKTGILKYGVYYGVLRASFHLGRAGAWAPLMSPGRYRHFGRTRQRRQRNITM